MDFRRLKFELSAKICAICGSLLFLLGVVASRRLTILLLEGGRMTYVAVEERYEWMTYRRCGRSGLLLPAVSLGAWETFGGYNDEQVARDCIYRAFDLGITHFDFANNYGKPPGNAELVCGRILKSMPRDELIISSKAGYRMWPGPYGEWGSRKYLIASCDQSLQRMDVEYFDILYSQRPDPDTP